MFDVLWTILLGIVGGIISSVIVSRVFMIQGEYQQQLKFVEGIIRKLGMIAGYLSACKSVFEVSYDEDIRKEREIKEKGYKCEVEYYAAHKEKDWISAKGILKTFKSEMLKIVESAKEDILNSNVGDKNLSELLSGINDYLHDISSARELDFSTINQFERNEQKILDKFNSCKQISGKRLAKLILKDKIMIILYVLVGLLIASTVLAFFLGI